MVGTFMAISGPDGRERCAASLGACVCRRISTVVATAEVVACDEENHGERLISLRRMAIAAEKKTHPWQSLGRMKGQLPEFSGKLRSGGYGGPASHFAPL